MYIFVPRRVSLRGFFCCLNCVIMAILSDIEIDEQCLAYVQGVSAGMYLYTLPAITLGFTSGLRVNEVVELFRWAWVSGDVFKVVTEKGSQVRLIEILYEAELMRVSLAEGRNVFCPTSASTLNRVVSRLGRFSDIKVGSKSIGFHLFRYNNAKKVYAIRNDYNDVAEFLGVTYAVGRRYADAEICGTVRE